MEAGITELCCDCAADDRYLWAAIAAVIILPAVLLATTISQLQPVRVITGPEPPVSCINNIVMPQVTHAYDRDSP